MVKNIPLSKLLKLELPRLANRVISVIEKQDPEILKFKESFDVLEGLKPQLKNLEAKHKGHPLTKKLNILRKDRMHFASLITTQIRLHVKSDKVDLRSSVEVAFPVVDRFLTNLYKNNDDQISELVFQFFAQVDSNEQLEDALTSLGVSSDLDQLRSVNSTMEELLAERNASITARPKMGTPPNKRSIHRALRNLFNQINLVKLQNPNLVYTLMIDELNGILTFYEGKINLRASINKRNADEAIGKDDTTENVVVIENQSKQPTEPIRSTVSTNGMYPSNVEVEKRIVHNGNLDPLSQQKNAAVSTNSDELQQIVSGEA